MATIEASDGALARDIIEVHGPEAATVARENARAAALVRPKTVGGSIAIAAITQARGLSVGAATKRVRRQLNVNSVRVSSRKSSGECRHVAPDDAPLIRLPY